MVVKKKDIFLLTKMLIKQKINFDCEIKQSALWSLFFLENLWSQKVQFSLIPELWISFMCLFTLCLFFIQTLQILNFSSCFSQSVTFMCFFRYSGMYSAIGSAFSNKYNFLKLCHKFHICDLQAWCGIFQYVSSSLEYKWNSFHTKNIYLVFPHELFQHVLLSYVFEQIFNHRDHIYSSFHFYGIWYEYLNGLNNQKILNKCDTGIISLLGEPSKYVYSDLLYH